MASRKTSARVFIVISVVALAGSLFPLPSEAVTKAQVDQACAESRSQLQDYRDAQAAFEEAAQGYEAAQIDVEMLESQQGRIQTSVDSHTDDLSVLEEKVTEQAVEMYMRVGFASPGIIFSASSVDELMTSTELLHAATLGGQDSINDLLAAQGELTRFQDDLKQVHSELITARAKSLAVRDQQEEAMNAERDAYSQLSGRCKQLAAKYDQEQAEIRARAAQRAAGSVQVGVFICPITPGRTSFIDSWGYPRSGGRTHKGVDMFAAKGEPMYAVQSGTVRIGSNTLGGKSIHLYANTGHYYYYAHLDGYAVSNGQRVEQGQTIGYVGNTGNARFTSPHLHFEIHPNGGAAVNPYPTVRAACY